MSGELAYHISGRVHWITLYGRYSVRAPLNALIRALRDPDAILPARILVDARESNTSHTASEVHMVVEELTPWAPSIDRIAVVASSDLHYGLARMGSILGEGAGVESSVFREYSDALDYLEVEARPSARRAPHD